VHTLSHDDEVAYVAFSPDNRYLVTCCTSPETLFERSARIWHVASGKQAGSPMRHADGVVYADFSPDGSRVVTASEDTTARVWEVPTGKPVLAPLPHPFLISEARFSANGRWIITTCNESQAARVWDARTGEPLTPPLKHPWPFSHAQFVADDRAILTRRLNGQSMLWELPTETRDIEELALMARVFSGSPQTPSDLKEAYQKLRKDHPNDFRVMQEDIISWHRREAEASEKAQQWGAAAFHWNQLIRERPDEQTFLDRLNRARDHLKTANASPLP
jgi:hypothetical protein